MTEENKDEYLTKFRQQLTEQFHKSFIDRVEIEVDKGDAKYIISLLQELIERLNNLVPNRKDLHQSLNSQIDLKLIKQQIEHQAFDSNDFYCVIDGFTQRIKLLQAPADENVLNDFLSLVNNMKEWKWGKAVGKCILEMNKIIDLIEKRIKEALQNPIVKEYIKLKQQQNK